MMPNSMCSMEPQLSLLGDHESQKEVFVSGTIKNSSQAGKQGQASSELVRKSAPTPTPTPRAPPTDNGEAPSEMLSHGTGPLIRDGNEKQVIACIQPMSSPRKMTVNRKWRLKIQVHSFLEREKGWITGLVSIGMMTTLSLPQTTSQTHGSTNVSIFREKKSHRILHHDCLTHLWQMLGKPQASFGGHYYALPQTCPWIVKKSPKEVCFLTIKNYPPSGHRRKHLGWNRWEV